MYRYRDRQYNDHNWEGKNSKQFLSASDVSLKYNIEYPKIPFHLASLHLEKNNLYRNRDRQYNDKNWEGKK